MVQSVLLRSHPHRASCIVVAAAYSVLSHLNAISIVLSVDKHVPNDEIKLTETIQYIIVFSLSLSNYSLALKKRLITLSIATNLKTFLRNNLPHALRWKFKMWNPSRKRSKGTNHFGSKIFFCKFSGTYRHSRCSLAESCHYLSFVFAIYTDLDRPKIDIQHKLGEHLLNDGRNDKRPPSPSNATFR